MNGSTPLQPGTRGNPNAKILIVGESYGANEEAKQQPFVGASGQELDKMLREAGITPDDCYYTNVINMRPASNEMHRFFIPTKEAKAHGLEPFRGLYPGEQILDGLLKLYNLMEKLQPDLVIGFGNYSLWALTESNFRIGNGQDSAVGYKVPTGIASYRGSQLRTIDGRPFLPTLHPAFILRSWADRNNLVHDLRARAGRYIRGRIQWGEPSRNYIVQPSFDQCMEVIHELLGRASMARVPVLVSCDIESVERFMDCVGLAWSRQDAICIPIFYASTFENYWTADEEAQILAALAKLLAHPNIAVTGQNFFYDYQYFFYYMRCRPSWRHDTMLLHHVCFPGTPADLNHISSLYCDWHVYWKDDLKESKSDGDDIKRWVYNCRDTVTTWEATTALWDVVKYYGLEEQYAIQMVRAHAIMEPMLRGTLVDQKKRSEELGIHLSTVENMEAGLEASMPESVWQTPGKQSPWYRSAQQLSTIFYDVLGLPEVRDRKTYRLTTNNDAISKIKHREPIMKGLMERIEQYRTMEAFGQFLTMKLGTDGRMRCSFAPTTETFRYRSGEDAFGSGRNLMNLPKGKED